MFTCRLPPFTLELLGLVDAVSFGVNFSAWQAPTAKRELSGAVAPPPALVAVPVNCCAAQSVGLKKKPGRSMTASIERRSVGPPLTIWGSGSVVTSICAVVGSTLIFALVTIVPRLNGPAITGVTIDSPNGAPL